MDRLKKFLKSKNLVIVAIILTFGILLGGLQYFKNSFAESGTAAASYYKYMSRYYSEYYKFTYNKKGQSSLSTKNDVGYMRLGINGSSSNTINVFCGYRGKRLRRVTSVIYHRVNFDQFYSSKSDEWRTKLSNLLMLYTPNVTSVDSIKNYLSTNYSTEYNSGGLSNITKDEIIVAFQSAIWTFTNGDTNFSAQTKSASANLRINTLHNILIQKTSTLKNVSSRTGSINFNLESGIVEDTAHAGHYIFKISTSKAEYARLKQYTTNDYLKVVSAKTSNGFDLTSLITQSGKEEVGDKVIITIGFNTTQTLDGTGKLILGTDTTAFDSLYLQFEAINSSTDKTPVVYKPTSSDYQTLLGSESTPMSSFSNITVPQKEETNITIEIDKVDQDNLSASSLKDAYLKLYRKLEDGSSVLIAEWLTGDTNKVISGLTAGNYYIDEDIYPEGYIAGTGFSIDGANIYYSKVSAPNNVFTLTTDYTKYYIHVHNKKSEVNFQKTDSTTGVITPGALLSIIDNYGVEYYQFTSTDGSVSIKGQLDNGVYFINELEAPSNHIKSNNLYRFSVGDVEATDVTIENTDNATSPYADMTIVDATYNSTTKTVTITNQPGISISKKSLVDNATYVVGATLIIENSAGEEIEKWVTTNADHIVTKTLADGDYVLKETIPGPGYATAESINFTILNGAIKDNVKLVMKDAPLNVCIAKKSTNVSGNLAGAEFELYDSSNILVTRFTSTDEKYCPSIEIGLKPGTYTLKETKAPKGYKGATTQKIVINDTASLQVFEVNNEVEVPNTSLNTSNIVYISIMVMGIVGIGLVCYYVKRYNY